MSYEMKMQRNLKLKGSIKGLGLMSVVVVKKTKPRRMCSAAVECTLKQCGLAIKTCLVTMYWLYGGTWKGEWGGVGKDRREEYRIKGQGGVGDYCMQLALSVLPSHAKTSCSLFFASLTLSWKWMNDESIHAAWLAENFAFFLIYYYLFFLFLFLCDRVEYISIKLTTHTCHVH